MTRLARRGVIEKVFSIVVVLTIVLLLGIFLYTSVFTNFVSEQTVARQSYQQEYGQMLIDSLLLSHENQTQLTYQALLSQALQQVDTTISVNGNTIDVPRKFSSALDALLGKDNYYLELRPSPKGVAISYVLDGSQTMLAKRESVNEKLPGLISRLQALLGKDAVVLTNLYILDSADGSTHCGDFTNQPVSVVCHDLSGDAMYAELQDKGFDPPYPAPYTSYNVWLHSTHAASTAVMSESDWASGAAYASYKYAEDVQARALTNKHIIVAVADEMTTNSKADECLGLYNTTNMFFCNVCNATCPVQRANNVINQTNATLNEHGDLFIGFYELSCDYKYSASTQVALTPYLCTYLDNKNACATVKDKDDPSTPATWTNPPANANFCEQQACGGCTKPSSFTGTYCLHANCNDNIVAELNTLSATTQGTTQSLDDLDQLTTSVESYLQSQITAFNFKIGVKDEKRDRYVIEKKITLSNGQRVTLTFWIYDTRIR